MLMLGSAMSNQSGAAVGALAFTTIGPVGVVAIRQWVAGAVLLIVARPRIRSFTRRQWVPVIELAAVFAVMNLAVYVAIGRVGLAMAVTLEFVGPLVIAVAGALTQLKRGTRRRVTVGCALVAGAGVLVLARPQPSTDYVGVGIGLLAATCWAGYILLNRTVGERFTGVEGSAAAGALSAVVYLPIGAAALITHPPTATALACGVTAGVLASVVPFVTDVLALKRVPAHYFGVCMSVNPVFAAAIGALVLGETLVAYDWLAISLIVAANAGASLALQTRQKAASTR
jgi:inner membrane transporter RhtA